MTSNHLISVIIPTLNEEKAITYNLAQLDGRDCEVIVVDGGSRDKTVEIAHRKGVQVIISRPGRGIQLNKGAEAAQGEMLLFVHADTILPENFQFLVKNILEKKEVIAGAFKLGVNSEGWKYRLIEKAVTFRSSVFNLPYGDQAIFMRKKNFLEVGGFQDLELMEDVSLMRKIAGKGKIELVGEKVMTSSRRWQKYGVLRTTVVNQLLLWGFFLGFPPHFLARCYYGGK